MGTQTSEISEGADKRRLFLIQETTKWPLVYDQCDELNFRITNSNQRLNTGNLFYLPFVSYWLKMPSRLRFPADSVDESRFDLRPVSVRWLQPTISLGLTRRSVLTTEAKPLRTSNYCVLFLFPNRLFLKQSYNLQYKPTDQNLKDDSGDVLYFSFGQQIPWKDQKQPWMYLIHVLQSHIPVNCHKHSLQSIKCGLMRQRK